MASTKSPERLFLATYEMFRSGSKSSGIKADIASRHYSTREINAKREQAPIKVLVSNSHDLCAATGSADGGLKCCVGERLGGSHQAMAICSHPAGCIPADQVTSALRSTYLEGHLPQRPAQGAARHQAHQLGTICTAVLRQAYQALPCHYM